MLWLQRARSARDGEQAVERPPSLRSPPQLRRCRPDGRSAIVWHGGGWPCHGGGLNPPTGIAHVHSLYGLPNVVDSPCRPVLPARSGDLVLPLPERPLPCDWALHTGDSAH